MTRLSVLKHTKAVAPEQPSFVRGATAAAVPRGMHQRRPVVYTTGPGLSSAACRARRVRGDLAVPCLGVLPDYLEGRSRVRAWSCTTHVLQRIQEGNRRQVFRA